jgi:glycosyltransferase involved in cell wall biosynthesis
MQILQICNKVPFPPKDGGCIAMNNLTQGLLNEGHKIKVVAINTPKHFTKIEDLPHSYRTKTNIEAVFIDTSVKPIPAFLNLFGNGSYNISRFYSEDFEKKIIQVLTSETFDVVQLESLFVSMYIGVIRKYSKAKIVLRSHNIEYKLWERNAAAAENILKRLYFKFLAKRLEAYEKSCLSSYDAVAAITKEDAEWFRENGFKKNISVIPFGIDINSIEETNIKSEKESLFHIGAMDWEPNIEGINWFLENVWGKVQQKFPSLKLYLAGRKMSPQFKNLRRDKIVVLGEVENAHDFIRSKGLMIVPLLSGGGMRVKIIEGMALGKVIVTTSIGAEGIDCENGRNILIADDPEAFVASVSYYLSDNNYLEQIGKNAREFAVQHYNNADISKQLTAFYSTI